jgi:hypothetical protein
LHTLLRVFSRKKIVGIKAFSQKTEEENSKMTGYFARMFSNFYGYFSLVKILHWNKIYDEILGFRGEKWVGGLGGNKKMIFLPKLHTRYNVE